jgi:hypothetical protein
MEFRSELFHPTKIKINVGNERFLNSLQHALENIVLHGTVLYP